MKFLVLSVSVLFLFTVNTFSQVADSIRLFQDDLPGMEEKRWAKYDQNSLWGYINGGADLYLEYGFSEVSAQDFSWEGESFRVDAYIMDSPKAAFGIFSVSRYNCGNVLPFAEWSCVSQYQVQVAHGNVYLSVVAYSGSEKGSQLAVQIAEHVVKKLNTVAFNLPNILNSELITTDASKIKLITGQLAMQNSFPSMEMVFETLSGYSLWVVPFVREEIQFTMLLCKFQTENELNIALGRFQETLSDSFKVVTTSKGLWMLIIQSKEEKVNPDVFNDFVEEFYRTR